jgi:chaperonin GroES
MNFTITLDRVLVKQDAKQEKTLGGFFIPEVIQEKSDRGTAVMVGPGKLTKNGDIIPMTVNVDDRVLFSIKDALAVKVDGQDYLVLKEDDIIAIVD